MYSNFQRVGLDWVGYGRESHLHLSGNGLCYTSLMFMNIPEMNVENFCDKVLRRELIQLDTVP